MVVMVSGCLLQPKPVIGERPERHSSSPIFGNAGYSLGRRGVMGDQSGGGDVVAY